MTFPRPYGPAALAILALFLLVTPGCLGKHAPEEVFVRLSLASSLDCNPNPDPERPVLLIRELETVNALDRQTVMLAKNRVLSPSTIWYWEDQPPEITARLLRDGLNCRGAFRAVDRRASRVQSAGVVSGEISAFEVETAPGKRFVLAADLTLWSPRGRTLISQKSFHLDGDMEATSPQEIARAAERTFVLFLDEVEAWLLEALKDMPGEEQ